MPRIATVHRSTTAIGPTGRGITLQAGTYPIVELDGVPPSAAYVADEDGSLFACVNADDPNITVSEGCWRCGLRAPAGVCCSSHGRELCHGCYRRTHFVETCVADCPACAREGLPVKLGG